MATLSDEHLRALRLLALHPSGCTELTLLEQGFTTGQLGHLVYAGLAKLREGAGRTSAKVFRVKITTAGRKAIKRPSKSTRGTPARSAREGVSDRSNGGPASISLHRPA
jgi:hypothetical protein